MIPADPPKNPTDTNLTEQGGSLVVDVSLEELETTLGNREVVPIGHHDCLASSCNVKLQKTSNVIDTNGVSATRGVVSVGHLCSAIVANSR
ncbi:MAG: hypothetical protein IID33_05475 [Planctomycetes bacterium]|nr:hypothetical protein [Planctomycetota bacterium]